MIGAGIQSHDRIGPDIRDDERAIAIGVLGRFVDREAQLSGRHAHAAGQDGVELQPAGIENQRFLSRITADRDPLGGACAPVGCVHEIAARRQLEDAGPALCGRDERQFSVRPRIGTEDPPGQAPPDFRAFGGKLGQQRDLARTGGKRRVRLRRGKFRQSGNLDVDFRIAFDGTVGKLHGRLLAVALGLAGLAAQEPVDCSTAEHVVAEQRNWNPAGRRPGARLGVGRNERRRKREQERAREKQAGSWTPDIHHLPSSPMGWQFQG